MFKNAGRMKYFVKSILSERERERECGGGGGGGRGRGREKREAVNKEL